MSVPSLIEYTLPDEVRDALAAYMQRVSDNGLADGRNMDTIPREGSTYGKVSDGLPYEGESLLNAVMAQKLEEFLPPQIKQALIDFRAGKGPPGIVLHNMPMDKVVPPTPDIEKKKGWVSEYTMRGVADWMKTSAYREKASYRPLIQRAVHEENRTKKHVGEGQKFHSDRCGAPRFVMLDCSRGHEEAKTSILSIDDVIAEIKRREDGEAIIALLCDKKYVSQEKFLSPELYRERNPILVRHGDSFGVTEFLYPDTEKDAPIADDEKHQRAVHILEQTIDKLLIAEQSIVLKPGDIFLIDNHRSMHRVSGYHVKDDPAQYRFVQRAQLDPRDLNEYDADPEFVHSVACTLENPQFAELSRSAQKYRHNHDHPFWARWIKPIRARHEKEAERLKTNVEEVLTRQKEWEAENPKGRG